MILKNIFLGKKTSFISFYFFLIRNKKNIKHFNVFKEQDVINMLQISQINSDFIFSCSVFIYRREIVKKIMSIKNVIAIYSDDSHLLDGLVYNENILVTYDKEIEIFCSENDFVIPSIDIKGIKFDFLSDFINYQNLRFIGEEKVSNKKESFFRSIIKNSNSDFMLCSMITNKIYRNDFNIDYLLNLYKRIL